MSLLSFATPDLRGGRVALWLDDSVEAHVLAAWCEHLKQDWFALVPASAAQDPAKLAVVDSLLRHFSRPFHPLDTLAGTLALTGLLACVTRAVEAGANTVCLPVRRDLHQPVQAARIGAANALLKSWGLNPLVFPLWRATDVDVARLGLALSAPVPFDCQGDNEASPHEPNCLRWMPPFRSLGLTTPCSLGHSSARGGVG